MFPTFISILDIQSWWEVPSIAHFCSLFRSAFNLLDFDIEDLEEALLTDGTEESSWLQELIVRLLSGCLPNNEISTFNYQMFLRRLFRQKCQEHDQYNPFNTDIDFQLLPLRTKVDILHALCDFRLDAEDVLDQLKNLEADSLRVEPLGYDNNESAYWYFYGTRLYREDFKIRNNKKVKSVWQVICFTEEDWFQLAKKFKKSESKVERQLYRTLTENFLPELPRLFREKEKLARKRLLENQPRRTSSRLGIKRKQENVATDDQKARLEVVPEKEKSEEEKRKKKELERKRREAYERRARLRKHSEDRESVKSDGRYEMAGAKTRDKTSKSRHRQNSESSSSSREQGNMSSSSRSTNRTSTRSNKKGASPSARAAAGLTTVGRQTNNSLASATGQIVIQPVSNLHRKKLKTSQVFSQTEEDLQTGMHKILDYVKNHDDAWPFLDPVEEEYAPNYYSVIRKPMDLQRMEERLDSGHYKTFSRFRADFQLIVDNCRLYNGTDNEYTEMVDSLLQVFERATERYLDQITSSDEEIAVEFPDDEADAKSTTKRKKDSSSKRKPTLAAQTDRKRERSVSEESIGKKSDSVDCFDNLKTDKKQAKINNAVDEGKNKKQVKSTKVSSKIDEVVPVKNETEKKKTRKSSKPVKKPIKRSPSPSPVRSRSRSPDKWSSSPPPSWPPSSPESKFDCSPRKNNRNSYHSSEDEKHVSKGKQKEKHDKWKEIFREDSRNKKNFRDRYESPPSSSPKHKDKHNKLRETIEKLKAKSEMSTKFKEKSVKDKPKENQSSKDRQDNKHRKQEVNKNKAKPKGRGADTDLDDGDSTVDSSQSENKKQQKKNNNAKNSGAKNAAIEALTLATEQTLKDINKWLDDTPRFSEFSSASNSPSHFIGAEEFDSVGNKIEHDYRKKLEKPLSRKDGFGKDIKRRPFHRDPTKFLRKREVQRTIDRLQPGKSKGNLLSNIQNVNKTDELFPLGPLSKIKDSKNSLIVKTDESAPKLSLGSVLDSFGKHKFIDDPKKEEELDKVASVAKEEAAKPECKKDDKEDVIIEVKGVEKRDVKKESPEIKKDASSGKATPNLSAWFKAFGAPKVQLTQKKPENKVETKESEKVDDTQIKPFVQEQKTAKDEPRKIAPPDVSPNPDSPVMSHGQPAQRQRKISTGSSMSERSSFSQDMDSPRVGIDERLGAYPAPYPSPLHRSPSGASPIMASPRPDVSPKAASYPTLNGQIRVGFYQDTVSSKSSPDKSCSPRDNPQSPYTQYSEQVYTPSTTSYSYTNPPYYSQTPTYSSSNPTPPYNPEHNSPSPYYDTSKPLTDQYQAKIHQSTSSPALDLNQMPSPDMDTYRQQINNRVPEKHAMFPVKKRTYNENQQNNSPQDQQNIYNTRNLDMGLNVGVNSDSVQARPSSREVPKHYVLQNIPEPRSTSASQVQVETYSKAPQNRESVMIPQQSEINYPASSYNYNSDSAYPLNISSSRSLDSDRKMDMSKYTNMGYGGPEIGFARNPSDYNRTDISTKAGEPSSNQSDLSMRYPDPQSYKGVDANLTAGTGQQTSLSNSGVRLSQPLDVPNNYKTSPAYSTPSTLNLDQSMSLRGNLANLTHIVDRYQSDERMLSGLQPAASSYYSEKGLASPHMFGKSISTSAPGLPIFSQPNITMPYGHEMQATSSSMYNRQMTELQNPVMVSQQAKTANMVQQQQEKKSKRRKSSKSSTPPTSTIDTSSSGTPNQGFQSYAGLKNSSAVEPGAISLKTASVVPGSAFNFGPTPTGLGLSSGLYGDKDAYPNFLEDYRAAPNYYMAAAAAAHHRSTPEAADKQARVAHQSSTSSTSNYPFIGAPQPRPPSYPLGGPFMPPPQASLMDTSSPLYQQYLQAGVLHQGLLGPPGAYPTGYHPALSMRQPYDSMTRPPWL